MEFGDRVTVSPSESCGPVAERTSGNSSKTVLDWPDAEIGHD